jgi:vitamin B12 transporter
MLFIRRCGFFILILGLYPAQVLAQKDPYFDLEPIKVTKSNTRFLKVYSRSFEKISQSSARTPIASLSEFPIDLASRNPNADIQTDFSLRAANPGGVLVAIDGQRVNDPQTHHHNSDIPLTREDIQRIEVIPGASSSLFGPDAAGGAINIVTKKPQEKKTVLETSVGYPASYSSILSLSEKINDLVALRFSQENQASRGFREDTDFNKSTTTFSSALGLADAEADLNFGYQQKEFGAYDFYTPGAGYPSQEKTRTYFLNAGLGLEREGLTVKPDFLWRRHYDKFRLDKTEIRSRAINHHRTDMYAPTLYFAKRTDYLGDTALGLEYAREQINSDALGNHRRSRRSAYLQEEKELSDALALAAAARIDDYDSPGRIYTGSVNAR